MEEVTIQNPVIKIDIEDCNPRKSPNTNQPEDSNSSMDNENIGIIVENNKSKKVRHSRIKEKVSQAKNKYPPKVKLIKKDPEVDKKQKQLVRNRLSAQRSRERKKQELTDLKLENEVLARSKFEVEQKLAMVSSELDIIKNTVELLSPESREEFNKIHNELNQEYPIWTGKPTKCRSPILLAGAFLGCFCLIACISPFIITNESIVIPQDRLLVEKTSEFEPQYANLTTLAELQ